MARQTRIVSFEDAKTASRRRASNQPKSDAARKDDQRKDGARKADAQRANARKSDTRKANAQKASARKGDARRAESRKAEEVIANSRSKNKRDQRRRQRSKSKADKMFDKQFAAEASKASQDENAPRAALYEGKMGQNHRKATRMQQKSSSAASTVRNGVSNASGFLSGFTITSRNLKITTAVACVLIALVFLYTPAQQYYQAHREQDRLTIERSTIEERNDALNVQNDALVSDAGMEDAVRQKFGYIRYGEETAIVTGLSDETTNTARDSENIEANVLSSSVKAPEEWYTPFLDALFGVG